MTEEQAEYGATLGPPELLGRIESKLHFMQTLFAALVERGRPDPMMLGYRRDCPLFLKDNDLIGLGNILGGVADEIALIREQISRPNAVSK